MSKQTDYIRVQNNTGARITKGHVTHGTEDYGLQSVSLEGLDHGDWTEAIAVYTGPSSRDYWYICWTNDGADYTAWNGIEAVSDHSTSSTAGSIKLYGQPGQTGLKVVFETNGSTEDSHTILNPWDD